MRKLTLRTAAALALATCFSSIASAQTADPVDFYYEGPLDTMGSQFGSTNQGPLGATAARSETQYRSVQSAPPEPQWRGVRSAPQQPQYQGALTAPRQTQYRGTQSSPTQTQYRSVRSAPSQPQYYGALTAPRQPQYRDNQSLPSETQFRSVRSIPPQAQYRDAPSMREETQYRNRRYAPATTPATTPAGTPRGVRPEAARSVVERPRDVFDVVRDGFEPAYDSEVRSLAPSNAPQVRAFSGEVGSIQPAMPTFTDPVTEPEFYSASQGQLANIPPPADPTRFGFRDGLSFGFDNTRLTNPLNGVQLDLQGAPTADFGPAGCDEWDGFCRMRDLEQNCNCGGLKVNPGHLGIPWLGSKDNCDQTTQRKRLRDRRCIDCEAQSSYDSGAHDAGCTTCGHHN